MPNMDCLLVKTTLRTLILLLSLLISGCDLKVEPKRPVAAEVIHQELEEAANPKITKPTPSLFVQNELLPPLNLNVKESKNAKTSANARFDVSVDEVPVKQFYLGLVEDTPYNIVVHPSIQGNISLQLSNVTVPEVMDILRDQYGFEYEQTNYGYKVLQLGLRTKVFQVNYLNASRTGNSDIRVSAGRVTNVTQSNSGNSDSNPNTNTGSVTTNEGLGTQIKTLTNADFWTELQRTLQIIIGNADGRAVVVNPQVGVVLVRAMPNELNAVAEYLHTTETNAQRQVLLETKILEVALQDNYTAGIDWSHVASLGKLKGTFTQSHIPDNPAAGITNFLNLDQDPIGTTLDGIFSATLNYSKFSAFIELLESQGNVQVLSSPQVSTLNNQKAVIRVGDDEFFITDVSLENDDNDNNNSDDNTTNSDVTFTPFFSGIALDVTPQISKDGYIILHVHPSVSEVQDDVKEVQLGSTTRKLSVPLALSSIRESDTIVRAENGQVVVIGGLILNETKEEVTSTPLLGDMPIVGSLFRQTRQKAVKSELVILIKPTIIEHGNFRQSIINTQKRFRENERGFHQGGKTEIFGNLGEFEPY